MSSEQVVTPTIGMIILAAGASIRMGTPKQLLVYRGRSFLSQIVETAITSMCHPIVVVLGVNAQRFKPEVSHFPVQVVENLRWCEGMSASIKVGMEALVNQNIEGVVITLCDQPFVSTQIINQLIAAYHSTGKSIVACEYAGTLGVPALFSRALFPELMKLDATAGAKYLIKKHSEQVFSVSFPEGAIDIDTPQDYEHLIGV